MEASNGRSTDSEPSPSLARLRTFRHTTRLLYQREAASICDFVRNIETRTVVARVESADDEGPADPTQHATCTCFVVAHLVEHRRARRRYGGSSERQFLGRHTSASIDTVLRDFADQYRSPNGEALAVDLVEQAKDTWRLPNWYNTPLHLSGLAAAVHASGGASEVPAELVALGSDVADRVALWLVDRGGFVPDVDAPDDDPDQNPYLTYWCVRSLIEWAEEVGTADARVEAALGTALESSRDYLARILVANHAGIGSVFDAPDLVCTLGVVALASRWLQEQDEFVAAVLPHGIDVLFGAYVHRDGSFAPNTPVLETRTTRRVITASSEELNAILIHAFGVQLTARQLLMLEPAVEHTDRKASGPRGWGSSAIHSPHRRTAFVTAGALAFLRGCLEALDRVIAEQCERELGVSAYTPDPQVDGFVLPESIAPLVDKRIVRLVGLGRRDLAVMSLILVDRRSALRHRVVRHIAQLLQWPMVSFDPSSFATDDGPPQSEIGRTIDLVGELTDTVVFFDGLDDDRFPGTSLLDKLDRLGQSRKVLMVIGSSRTPRDWPGADGTEFAGNVFVVAPPGESERREVLAGLMDRFGAGHDVVAAFAEAEAVERTNGYGQGFLEQLVRTCMGLMVLDGAIDAATVDRERQNLVQRLDAERTGSK